MDDDDLTLSTVICHTDGCENAGVPITLPVADVVVCGPCGQTITDITPA